MVYILLMAIRLEKEMSPDAVFPLSLAQTGPIGAGCYELRAHGHKQTHTFRMSGNVVLPMTSLLPKPYGRDVQNNERKRQYVLAHVEAIEYRTLTYLTRQQQLRNIKVRPAGRRRKKRAPLKRRQP